MRRRDRPGGPAGMLAHLVEFREEEWLDVDVSGAANFGTDADRYATLRRRNAFTRARHEWLREHGLVDA